MKKFHIILSVVSIFLAGCGEDGIYKGPAPVLIPSHIQKISVRPFANRTQFPGLEDKLRLRVEEEFIRDGRVSYVNRVDEASGVVEGEIVNYIREYLSYDANNVAEEERLLVVINIRFVDMVNNVVLWEEKRLDHDYRHFLQTKPGGITEQEAQDILWDLYARDIVKRTIEGFGSVTGASEKKLSHEPLPSFNREKKEKQKPSPPRVAPPSPY